MLFPLIASILWVIALALIFGFTPETVADGLIRALTPKDSLRRQTRQVRQGRKKRRLYKTLLQLRTALTATGKRQQFAAVCFTSLLLFVAGAVLAILLHNLFLLPALAAAFALLPFFYTARMLTFYETQTKEELETALAVITTAYIRTDDILSAVRENLLYIKPPLRSVFEAFEGEASAVTSSTKTALTHLRDALDHEIFREWCDTLIRCQDDRTLKDTLQPIVAKLTDVRIVNTELSTMLASARSEYWFMVALVAGNIPLLYLLNRDWYLTLLYSTPGKAVLGICGAVILVTALLMMRYTKPIEYKR